jgi:hypothetical protein
MLSLLSLLSYELVFKVKYGYNIEAIVIVIHHFLDEFTNKNNYCERRDQKIITISYNCHHRSPYYFIVLITLSIVLLMSSFIPGVVTANALVSNAANIEQQLTKSSLQTNLSNNNTTIPSAQSVYTSQSMTLPTSVRTFVWYMVNEAHENSATERHKYLSDRNAIYLPTNLVITQGTANHFSMQMRHGILLILIQSILSMALEKSYIALEKWTIPIVQRRKFCLLENIR